MASHEFKRMKEAPSLEDDRVQVAVSSEMEQLRTTQRFLNHFLWSTELAYGHVLTHGHEQLGDPDRLAADALSSIAAEAWYPSSQGRVKYRETVATFLEHVQSNTTNVCRAVLVFFHSAFEEYLEQRVRPLLQSNRGRRWGPLYESLAIPEVVGAKWAPGLSTVLRADLSRMIRNSLVHPPFQPPTQIAEASIQKWREDVSASKNAAAWGNPVAAMNSACTKVFGHADYEMRKAETAGKRLPVEFFFALYTFANLDSLAFELEEALLPRDGQPGGRVRRKLGAVRRVDLVAAEVTNDGRAPDAPA